MFSSKHAKFHAFITKVNNSALFWPLAARPELITDNLCLMYVVMYSYFILYISRSNVLDPEYIYIYIYTYLSN